MNYIEKIFDILGVKPNEKFKLKDNTDFTPQLRNNSYCLDNNLNLWYISNININEPLKQSKFSLQDIIMNKVEIIKIPVITKEEQITIDYAKTCGYQWLAQDKDGTIFAYSDKPTKYNEIWRDNKDYIKIAMPISFISWNDQEPYYIGD